MNEETPGLSVQVSKISINLWVYLQSHNSVIFKRDPQVSVLIHFSSPPNFLLSVDALAQLSVSSIPLAFTLFSYTSISACLLQSQVVGGSRSWLRSIRL